MYIAVVGQGYVGVTASACLAEAGHQVVGIERDHERLAALRSGKPPIYEPGLAELLGDAMRQGQLAFCSALSEVAQPLDAVLVAVGSPPLESGATDLRQVTGALGDIASMRLQPRLVVLKSTVPPGTSERLLAEASQTPSLRGRFAVSPEFLSLGSALSDWRTPSRVVVGLHNDALLPAVEDLYRGIEAPWVVTTPTSAEMIKYASNAYLATKVSFINEVANLCEAVGAEIDDVASGMGLDPRIGRSYLRAGVGYGGSCFPKDTRSLAHLSSLEGHSMTLVQAAVAVNNSQRLRVVRMIRDMVREPGAEVAVIGLSFKPGTDDLREAPSLTVVSELLALGFRVRVWDPVVNPDTAAQAYPGTLCTADLESALVGAQAAIVLTEWPELTHAPWEQLVPKMRAPRVLVDARNCLDPEQVRAGGGQYRGIGRVTPALRLPFELQDPGTQPRNGR